MENLLYNKKGFIFDLDGVVHKGDNPINETIEGIITLQNKGYQIGYLTNNSGKKSEDIASKLNGFGLAAPPEVIVTATEAAVTYAHENGYKKCFLVGNSALLDLSKSKGIESIPNYMMFTIPDAVIIGFCSNFEYLDLLMIYNAIQNGSHFICTDRDICYPVNGANVPGGTAWLASGIEAITNKSPFVAGKPNNYSLNLLLNKMKLTSDEIVIVGDSLDSDISAAKKAGALSCLLLGGISTREETISCETSKKPDIIIESFLEISQFLSCKDSISKQAG